MHCYCNCFHMWHIGCLTQMCFLIMDFFQICIKATNLYHFHGFQCYLFFVRSFVYFFFDVGVHMYVCREMMSPIPVLTRPTLLSFWDQTRWTLSGIARCRGSPLTPDLGGNQNNLICTASSRTVKATRWDLISNKIENVKGRVAMEHLQWNQGILQVWPSCFRLFRTGYIHRFLPPPVTYDSP